MHCTSFPCHHPPALNFNQSNKSKQNRWSHFSKNASFSGIYHPSFPEKIRRIKSLNFNSISRIQKLIRSSASVTDTQSKNETVSSHNSSFKRVIILGGSGRVGRSTALALSEMMKSEESSEIEIVISGRNKDKGEKVCNEIGPSASYVFCDISNPKQLRELISGYDLVINAAGPFQRAENCFVLEAAIETKTPYIDVCDDCEFSIRAKKLHEKAQGSNIPCITTTGIYPGISNLMAAEMIRLSKAKDNGLENTSGVKSLRFSYYTAGTGGAGPTILSTSFLLLGEEVIVYKDDNELRLKPYSQSKVIDFGKGVGRRSVYLLNLPEVISCHNNFNIPSVSARFGTSPQIWNWGMEAMANFVPQSILKDRKKVESMVSILDPFVRLFDGLSGERMSMRVDLEFENGKKAVGIFTHKSLSKCVGQATASFAVSMLNKTVPPGVWFPEQEGGISAEESKKILERASKGTIRFDLNKSPWMIETEPKWIGFGLYF